MKFTISSTELLKHLKKVSIAIKSNPILPILENILFEVKDGILKLSATDLEMSIISSVEIVGNESELSVAVPAKILLDTLKELSSQPITFSVNDKYGIEISTTNGKYKLVGETGKDYPMIPNVDEPETLYINSNVILKGLELTGFAKSTDELRAAMCGTFFELNNGTLTMVATDAHKLAKYTAQIDQTKPESFILPAKTCNQLKNILIPDSEIEIKFNKSNLLIESAQIQVITKLVDAKYPDYSAVIPIDNPITATFDKDHLKASLKRIGIFANKTTNQVVLNLNGKCEISAQDLDFSNEAVEEIDYKSDDEKIRIGFNSKYFVESLDVLESKIVKVEMSSPTRAAVLLPEDDDSVLILLMPVILSN